MEREEITNESVQEIHDKMMKNASNGKYIMRDVITILKSLGPESSFFLLNTFLTEKIDEVRKTQSYDDPYVRKMLALKSILDI